MEKQWDTIIVGGGASGFFLANLLCDSKPLHQVLILEKTGKILQKVKISGGGRCNVTHNETNPSNFAKNYPRGQNFLKKSLRIFGQAEMISWLERKGVALKTEADNRMFPVSNDSQTIVDCLQSVLKRSNCHIEYNQGLMDFSETSEGILVKGKEKSWQTTNLVFAAGSAESLWQLLAQKKIDIISSVPSLFSFKINDPKLKELSGVSVPNLSIKLLGSKLQSSGPWLITHQGISGPAVLKLSAFGAREMAEKNYAFSIAINFSNLDTWEEVNHEVQSFLTSNRLVVNNSLFDLPKRLWEYLVDKCDIPTDKKCADLSKKEMNKLTEELFQGNYSVLGKNTFKDEFVTAGGVSLDAIDQATCKIKKLENIYAIGEFLNVDGVTGGFNFQSCWTTAFLASEAILKK